MKLPDDLSMEKIDLIWLQSGKPRPQAVLWFVEQVVRDCAMEVIKMRDCYGAYPDRASVDEIADTILSRYALKR